MVLFIYLKHEDATISPRLSVTGVLYKIFTLTRSLMKLFGGQTDNVQECEQDGVIGDGEIILVGFVYVI